MIVDNMDIAHRMGAVDILSLASIMSTMSIVSTMSIQSATTLPLPAYHQ